MYSSSDSLHRPITITSSANWDVINIMSIAVEVSQNWKRVILHSYGTEVLDKNDQPLCYWFPRCTTDSISCRRDNKLLLWWWMRSDEWFKWTHSLIHISWLEFSGLWFLLSICLGFVSSLYISCFCVSWFKCSLFVVSQVSLFPVSLFPCLVFSDSRFLDCLCCSNPAFYFTLFPVSIFLV